MSPREAKALCEPLWHGFPNRPATTRDRDRSSDRFDAEEGAGVGLRDSDEHASSDKGK